MTKQSKNKEASVIYEEYWPRLYAFTQKRISNREDAQDIVQDVFYQLVKTLEDTLSPIEHLSGWLFKVTRNTIINRRKKKRPENLPEWEYDEDGVLINDFSEILFNDNNDTPETIYLQNMVWEEFNEALDEIPKNQKEAFIMTEIDGLSTKEAAVKAGVNVNTLLSRKHYAVKQLRNRLKGIYDDILSQ